jgi:hypothetical protein
VFGLATAPDDSLLLADADPDRRASQRLATWSSWLPGSQTCTDWAQDMLPLSPVAEMSPQPEKLFEYRSQREPPIWRPRTELDGGDINPNLFDVAAPVGRKALVADAEATPADGRAEGAAWTGSPPACNELRCRPTI